MPKIRTTRRADGRITISGLDQDQYDALVSALTNARIAYRDSAVRLRSSGVSANAETAERLMGVADVMSDLGLQLASLASPVERESARVSS